MTLADTWSISDHALDRAVDMALDPEEIRRVMLFPDCTLPGCKPGRRYYRCGRITLSVDVAQRRVITILWTQQGPDDQPTRGDIERCRDVPAQRRGR